MDQIRTFTPPNVELQHNAQEQKLHALAEKVLQTSQITAEAITTLKQEGLPNAAMSIQHDLYPPELDLNDPNKIVTTELVALLMRNSGVSAERILRAIQEGEIKSADLTKVAQNVETTEMLAHATLDIQFTAIQRALKKTMDYIHNNLREEIHEPMRTAVEHPDDFSPKTSALLKQLKRLQDASSEILKANKLKGDPAALTDNAFAAEFVV